MERVSLAIDALKKDASKSKDRPVRNAVGELGVILTALKSSSSKAPTKLSDMFRNLAALYPALPTAMCNFCAAVLHVIYQEKVQPASTAEDFKLQFAWESVLKAVVSSVLDFIDQNPPNDQKGEAGQVLYPVICAMFYPPPEKPFKWKSTSLLFNVNLLLAESATEHQDNQRQLRRDKLLGPTRLGKALSQSKDFFVIDSLLNLIGVLLPSRQTAAKRTEFVDAVFTAELFPRSAQIKSLIAASSDTAWDPVGEQIICECLAKSDLSFPQPFSIAGLRTTTPLPNVVDPLYIDNHGLFSNIKKDDGSFDSYQVFFTTFERVKISGPGGPSATVSLQLIGEPLIGAGSEADVQKKKCTMQFQIKNADARRFLETLKARGLSKLIGDTKVSKIAEGLNLEFDSSGQKPATQQEKVAKVERLWQSNDTGLGEPTSPLVGESSKAGRKRDTSAANSDSQDASSQHDVIYGDDLSDMSDVEEEKKSTAKAKPPAPRAPPPASRAAVAAASTASRPHVRIVLDSDEEDGAVSEPQLRRAPRKSAMKKLVVEDDDEEIEESQSPPSSNGKDQDFAPTQEPETGRVVPARVTRGAAKKNPALTEDPVASKPVSGRSRASAATRDVDMDAADAPEPVRSIRRPAAKKSAPVDNDLSMSEDEIEMGTATDAKPSAKVQKTSAAEDTAKGRSSRKDDTAATKASAPETKSGRKRAKADEEGDVPEDQDASAPDRRPAKRSRGPIDVAPEEPVPPLRRVSAAVFGASNHAPAKKRYGGKKGRTSSPAPDDDAADTDMAVDYDELPAALSAPPPVAEKVTKAAKQEPGVSDTRKGRVAAMKGKAGQKPVAKPEPAPAKSSKAAPSGKNKTKTQTLTATKAFKENADVESDAEAKPTRRSTRATNAAPKTADLIVEVNVPKPKAKSAKPRKAPWEDMHLRKKDDVDEPMAGPDESPAEPDESLAAPDEPLAELDEAWTGSDTFEEYLVPIKGSSDYPPIPQDDIEMLDLTHDTSPKIKIEKTIPAALVDSTSALPLDPTSAIEVDSTSALPVNSAPALPLKSEPAVRVRVKSTSALALESTDPVPTVNRKSAVIKVNLITPIRPQTHSPVAESEPVLPPPMTKFKSDVPSHSIKPVAFPPKVASPSPPTPPMPVRPKKTPTSVPRSPPVHRRPSPRSPAHRLITNNNDSPFPERVYHTVAFAPTKASPPPSVQRNSQSIPARRMANNHAYEPTPDLGRPARTFGRGLHKHEADRDHDYKRSRSPMQGIFEVLNEINEVVAERISQRFDHVKNDVRIGRDSILRGAAANLEGMCTESEGHFNTLVDLEEEYAAYHRKIIFGIDDMQKSAEVMSNALGQVIQHHDRRSLSKKLPPTMFTLPSILRNPVLSL
ncbi:hypothetical protein B0H19DRAFT_1372736 [Mycena capillaripes]|nr:hypothetical protein B0H19DRAFT_1372736 [Mycena capillaripes]